MRRYIIIAVIGIFMFSCKAGKTAIAEGSAREALGASKIIGNHYSLKRDFSTVYIKSNARYKDEKTSQSVTAEIKIRKDEQILVSIRVLGITMAKAYITPNEVKYYEKIGGKYFEGDYSSLSKWLGTDLDFKKVQNMLIGEAMDDLNKEKYKSSVEEKLYKLEDTSNRNTQKSFFFEATNFLIKKQQIIQNQQDRMLKVEYPNHKEFPQTVLPASILIEATQESKKTNISIDYNTVTFNEDLSFPYSVPDGYERIYID